MNKKLVSLAVAAALAAPTAVMAEATIYGKLHASIDYVDVDDFAEWGAVPYGNSPFTVVGTTFDFLGIGFDAAGDAVAVEGLADGVTADDGTVLSEPVTGDYTMLDGTVLTNATMEDVGEAVYNELIASGVDPVIAEVQAIQSAAQFGAINADINQIGQALALARANAGSNQFKGWGVNQNSRSSRIGVKGSEDLGGGLKAIYQVEFGVDLSNESRDSYIANGNRGNGIVLRNTFVGLAGGFGTFLVGRHDTPHKISSGKLDLFADTLADYNYTVGFHDVRADNAVAYISPSFSGFQFAGAVIPSGGATALGGWNTDADSAGDAWSVALIYANGPFYASAAYEKLGDEHWKTANIGGYDLDQDSIYRGLYGKGADDDTKWRIGLGLLDWNGFTLTGIYESRTNVFGAPSRADLQLWQIQAGYAFGNNTIKGMYGQVDAENCADPFGDGFRFTCNYGLDTFEQRDKDTWAIGFDHNFSKRTKAYVLYTAVDDDSSLESDWSGFSLGMIHKF